MPVEMRADQESLEYAIVGKKGNGIESETFEIAQVA